MILSVLKRPLHQRLCSPLRIGSARGSLYCRLLASWSQRDIAELESQIVAAVGTNVQDPVLQRPIGELEWLNRRIHIVESTGNKTLNLVLRLPSLLHPQLSELKSLVHKEATRVVDSWLPTTATSHDDDANMSVTINVEAEATTTPIPMMARLVEDHEQVLQKLGPGLQSVAHVVAVYSAKGGVGKSTVAVNLAYTLARQGGRVGLLDLDLYGPSLPILVRPESLTIQRSPLGKGMVYPLSHDGVKLLSLGFVNRGSGVPGSGEDNGAAIMKGPMAVKVVTQLLKATDWGPLDVLLLDLPPGTGDVQLGVLQTLQLSGAVAVTTPSLLAIEDAKKGVQMFTSLGVPTVAVVENMAYLDVPGSTEKVFVFGKKLSNDFLSIPVIHLPLSMKLNECNEEGIPLMLQLPETTPNEMEAFDELGRQVSGELLRLQYGNDDNEENRVTFSSDKETFDISTLVLKLERKALFSARFVSKSQAILRKFQPASLRTVDPKTGNVLTDSPFLEYIDEHDTPPKGEDPTQPMITKTDTGKRPPSILPVTVERRGRYGFAVEWGDGATIIYSMQAIARCAGGTMSST